MGGAGGGSGPAPSATPNAPPARVESDTAFIAEPKKDALEAVRRKAHPSVLKVIERLKNKQLISSSDEARFIRDGKAEVQVWLNEKSEQTLAKLKELGFEVVLDSKTSKLVIGRVSIEKLEALASLNFVRYVSPQEIK
jgi:hypothetical protein